MIKTKARRANIDHAKLNKYHFTKQGMETWQLVLIILALIVLVLVVIWYSGLNESIKEMLDKMIGAL